MQLDLNDALATLLAEVAEAAAESGNHDALALIAQNAEVRSSFIELCQQIREAGANEVALVEFGPIKDQGNHLVLSNPADGRRWPVWNVLVSADSKKQ